jgi:hypothetical protein
MYAYLSCSADLCSQSVLSAHYEYIYECVSYPSLRHKCQHYIQNW